MPSKGKKPSRPDRSPISRSPSTSASARGLQSDDEEVHLRELLSQASSKYPNFINETAIIGTICGQDSDFTKGNQAIVWLSESTMVSSSLAPGSLVSVSLPSPRGKILVNSPLGNFSEERARHFGSDFGDEKFNEIGNFFAIATVSPSRKVLKNEVRLSGGISSTMGFPATGRSLFVFPIRTSKEPIEADCTTHVYVHNCKHLYLNLVAPEAGPGTGSIDGTSIEADSVLSGNRMSASPRTPSCQSKLLSPGTAPVHARKTHDIITHPNSSVCLDTSAARLALADEKTKELLQMSAVRWLSGRYLLNGNIVTVPLIFGEICVFRVEGEDSPLTVYTNQALMLEKKDCLMPRDIQLSNPLEVVLLVDSKTDVQLYDSISSASEKPSKNTLAKVGLASGARSKEAGDRRRLGGLSKEFAALKEIIEFSLTSNSLMPRYKGVLLYGPPGTGKTSLASYCAEDANIKFCPINGPEIVNEYYGESEQKLSEVFDSARKDAPAVVFIDELDAIAPTRNDGGEALSLRMVATLLKQMDEIREDDGILVIAATNRPDSIDPAMRRPGRLDREIEIGVPSPEQRLDILRTLMCDINHSLSILEIQNLASATHGFVGADLAALCNAAAWNALHRHIQFTSSDGRENNPSLKLHGFVPGIQGSNSHINRNMLSTDLMDSLSSSLAELTVLRGPLSPISSLVVPESCDTPSYKHSGTNGEEHPTPLIVTMEDFEKAKVKVRPSAMREVMLELPKVRWEDVGGQEQVKKQLIEAVRWPQILPDAFERIGTRPPRGLLMMGPPGCSKTLMARAVASEAKLNFLAVKGPELFSKWVGESEKAVRSLFAKARANSPAIIFFDEIDGLAISRGQQNDGTSVADRVLSQLLVEMDALNQRAGVTVIAATNRPDKIDPALLRPGRFDRLLDVQPPDETDREVIFRIHMKNIACHPDVSSKDLACLTEGYTGADIKSVCREAALAALEESLEISEISMEHFKIGIGRVRPTDVQSYTTIATQFRRTANSASLRGGQ